MEFHPLVFVLIAYGIAAVIAVCVAFTVKIIAFIVRDLKTEFSGVHNIAGIYNGLNFF